MTATGAGIALGGLGFPVVRPVAQTIQISGNECVIGLQPVSAGERWSERFRHLKLSDATLDMNEKGHATPVNGGSNAFHHVAQ